MIAIDDESPVNELRIFKEQKKKKNDIINRPKFILDLYFNVNLHVKFDICKGEISQSTSLTF